MARRRPIRELALVGAVVCLTSCGPTIQTGVADAQLTMRVKTALLNDPEVGTQPIDVEVGGGVVTLHGRVVESGQVPRAERIARGVDGVRDVVVLLEVGASEVPSRERPGRQSSLTPPAREGPLRLVAVGASGTFSLTPEDELGNGLAVGPVVRLRPRNGWGPTVGFGWTRSRLDQAPDGQPGLADLVVRPVMGGVEYSVTRGRFATGFSLVGGYAFNSLAVDPERVGPRRAIGVDNSVALRAGVTLWYDVSPRVGLNLFTGYRAVRPKVTFADANEVVTRRIDTGAVMVSIGFAYWLF